MKKVLKFIAIISLSALRVLSVSYLLFRMWPWFIVQPLHVPALRYAESVGVMLVVGLLVGDAHVSTRIVNKQDDDTANMQIMKKAVAVFVGAPVMLLVAYVAHLAIG